MRGPIETVRSVVQGVRIAGRELGHRPQDPQADPRPQAGPVGDFERPAAVHARPSLAQVDTPGLGELGREQVCRARRGGDEEAPHVHGQPSSRRVARAAGRSRNRQRIR